MLLIPSGHPPLSNFTFSHTLTLSGYQLYAVEKWVVSRNRPFPLLVVYTGDAAHTVRLDALKPNTEADMKDAVHFLRLDARPKNLEEGTLMVTSLAHFRSDYTIVLIPGGDWLVVREQLYVNVNLLRMGCAGRTALTLESPSSGTRDRFVGMYGFPATVKGRGFNETVLEMVRLVQGALGMFGFQVEGDGLLCDLTVQALGQWLAKGFVPGLSKERLADPPVVVALLSLVFVVRNKAAAIGYSHVVPKDPFLHPPTPTATPLLAGQTPTYINHVVLETIHAAYEHSGEAVPPACGPESILEPIVDVRRFVAAVLGTEKGEESLGGIVRGIGREKGNKGVGSVVRALWSGRIAWVVRLREGVDGEKKSGWSDFDAAGSDRSDPRSTDEEGDLFASLAWGRKRVKGKLESWAGRRKKAQTSSVDLRPPPEDEDLLSSGQASPVVPPNPPPMLVVEPPSVGESTVDLVPSSKFDGMANLGVRKRPWGDRIKQGRCNKLVGSGEQLTQRRSIDVITDKLVKETRVLRIEHMRIDVELCGQMLGDVRLTGTNKRLREAYSRYGEGVSESILGEVDAEGSRSGKMMQTVNTLWYEAEQMSLRDAWHAGVGGRRKVVEVREKVFGLGLANTEKGGKHRQWRIDGVERVVDRYGRTESEAEEERGVWGDDASESSESEKEEQTEGGVEVSQRMRPVWLLKWFTRWGRTANCCEFNGTELMQYLFLGIKYLLWKELEAPDKHLLPLD
ncbi:uncharacterized protein EV420DRAFT_1635619 [Desarmillaria tabescens]|uniref:STB6-like N-terminal domain-containing protein n=1 Tax=Armillaria tabescens TaxID=1929756 RepID=A0AA39NMG4_ARMTA|nr:uncharacterized protein EV420DRAFT_1635619 [Desarmillaria tabescens]KAK0468369.1 hypothetical protein EV420DRAFT_1635619 [Desarmillaria tabescens]